MFLHTFKEDVTPFLQLPGAYSHFSLRRAPKREASECVQWVEEN